MSLKINIPQPELLKPKITIFGVGGAGGNAVNNMIRSNLEGVEFVAANTDSQALINSLAPNRIQLGVTTTRGLGAGSFPDKGRAAAEENIDEIEKFIDGNNMIFIAAGMGGGTGTGGAPVIAKLARERDILTVGVVTKPFHFEGKYRMTTAEAGIEELKKYVDTLIVIPNQNLFRIANESTTFESAFKMADDVLHAGVRGVTDLITMPGLVNLDFADIRTIMTKMGKAMMGTGEAEGENRAVVACEAAISNPLLDDISIKGAKGVLVNMTGGPDMTLFEADLAVNTIKREVDPNANIIFGSAFNENMKGKIRISVVATGIDVDDIVSHRNRDFSEPSRFRVSETDSRKKSDVVKESPNKSFFDIGNAAKLEEELVEINSEDLKPKKTYSKNPNLDYGKSEEKKEDENTSLSNVGQISFFEQVKEEEEDISEKLKKAEEKISEAFAKATSKTRTSKPVIAAKKKEASSSGFSLFGFMNSSKSRDHEEEEHFEEEHEDFVEEERVVSQKPKRVVKNSGESDLQEVAKRQKEFFGSTIFDEDSREEERGEKIEDDILNVPAFFRRKK
ncbi:MAG: cell division protein FtsZ [Pelagibacterales bacterium]|nr:cell division protein FtsZ [Pelagibacterales bacterium]